METDELCLRERLTDVFFNGLSSLFDMFDILDGSTDEMKDKCFIWATRTAPIYICWQPFVGGLPRPNSLHHSYFSSTFVSSWTSPYKGWFHELTNHADKRQKTADESKKIVSGDKLIGRPTNTVHLCIVLWWPTYSGPTY